MNKPHTIVLFVLSNIIIAAKDAAAPSSNPIANAQFIRPVWAKSKNATEFIIDIVATKKYKLTNMPMIPRCTILFFILKAFLYRAVFKLF